MRFLVVAIAALIGTQTVDVAQASTITYDLTLSSSIFGPEGGTGLLTVNSPVTTGTFTSDGGGLDALSISIDGQTYTLGNSLATASFVNGALASLSFVGVSNGTDLVLAPGLFYLYVDGKETSIGTITAAVDPPAAAPLPASIWSFAAGLLVLGLFAFWRKTIPLSATPA